MMLVWVFYKAGFKSNKKISFHISNRHFMKHVVCVLSFVKSGLQISMIAGLSFETPMEIRMEVEEIEKAHLIRQVVCVFYFLKFSLRIALLTESERAAAN